MASIDEHESSQIDRANASGKTPTVFIHGLWLLPSSWDRWAQVFESAGFTALTPGWPDDPETVDEANADPEVFAKKSVGDVADHFEDVIRKLDKTPVVIGHSFGGLLAQILAGRGISAATVAIDPAPFRGVLPLPISALQVGIAGPQQPAEPASGRAVDIRAVPLRVHERGGRGRGQAALRDVLRAGFG
jgi:non-heme chloroperoxidase